MPRLVAGIDSSTQSCKVLVVDADTGVVVRRGRAAHPDGTEVHPDHWWAALQAATADAGGLDDVAAVSVGGQQHGMVALDEDGDVVRPALLWNDNRSAPAAADLTEELGGAGGLGADRWAWSRWRRSRSPSCAGWPTTSPRRLPAPPPSACPTTGSRGAWPALLTRS